MDRAGSFDGVPPDPISSSDFGWVGLTERRGFDRHMLDGEVMVLVGGEDDLRDWFLSCHSVCIPAAQP